MFLRYVNLLQAVFNITLLGINVLLSLCIPSVKNKIVDRIKKINEGSGLVVEDYSETIYTVAFFRQVWRAMYLDVFKTATLFEQAPNMDVIKLDDLSRKKLLNFQSKGRPLVLNFGSCT